MIDFNDKEKFIAKELLENLNSWAKGSCGISFTEREEELNSLYGKNLVLEIKELLIDEGHIIENINKKTGVQGYSETMIIHHITQKGIKFLRSL